MPNRRKIFTLSYILLRNR